MGTSREKGYRKKEKSKALEKDCIQHYRIQE